MSEPRPSPMAHALVRYPVWDVRTRVLHWLNALLVLLSLSLGLLFMFRKDLAIDGLEAKMALKRIHSYVGYGVLACFLARLGLGLWGNRYARFAALWPTRKSLAQLPNEAASLLGPARRPHTHHLGHGPLGRLSSSALLLVTAVVLLTGLVRAGTDLWLPPFGSAIAAYVVADGVSPDQLTPTSSADLLDPERRKHLQRLKSATGPLHEYGALLLGALVVLHVAGLVRKELRLGGGIFSSMISGHKLYPDDEPVDPE